MVSAEAIKAKLKTSQNFLIIRRRTEIVTTTWIMIVRNTEETSPRKPPLSFGEGRGNL